MTFVSATSIYIPRYRLTRETIAQAWGGRAVPGSKAVTNFDEDSLTMAVAAASRIAGDRAPDRFYFASTTAPYWQRSTAAQISAACDWPQETTTADFGGSLRGGFSAMISAMDAIASGSASDVIVAVADRRDAPQESPEELMFGDAAAAVRLTATDGGAEVLAVASRSDDFLDEWRRDSDSFTRNYASKYTMTRGYEANSVAAAKSIIAKAGVHASDISLLAINSPDGRSHAAVAKALGVAPASVREGCSAEIGVTGAAMPLIALAQALASAKAGDLILAIAYGDGADSILLRASNPIAPSTPADKPGLAYSSYSRYRKSREGMRPDERGPEISNVLWKKEERQNVRLHGTKCMECGTVQFPITSVCTACRNSKSLLEVPLARTGSVFTFTKDYLYDAPVQPTVMAVIQLDGGGRFLCQMTDVDEREVRIGMRVELVLRRLRDGGQNHHYYWKSRPVEETNR